MDGYVFPSDPVANEDAVVKGEKYRFTIITDGLVRCEWADDGKFEDRGSTFVINRNLEVPKYRVTETDGIIDIYTDRFHLTYDKRRFSPSSLSVNVSVNVVDKNVNWGARWRYGDYSSSLGGTARTLDEADGRCEVGPGVVSKVGFSAIDDSKTMLFESDGWVSGRRKGEREDIYVFAYGHDFKDAIDAYYRVSGKQPVIPRWALGNWWSRYYAYSADEYLQLMDQFKEHDIPLSVSVIDMDWHLVHEPVVPHSGWTGYTWNKRLFPEPEKFLRELYARDLKVTPNDHPAEGVWSHEDCYESMAKDIGHDTTHKAPIQFDCTSIKYMKAYLKMCTSLNFSFMWVDWQQGKYSRVPGIDPLWVLNHFHYLENGLNNAKPLVFSRFGGPGSHRYPVGFSGDTLITWDSLNFQPEFTATASNIGYGWWSHDIGGHMGGMRDDEMATRWVQLAVFSPILRLHSSNSQWTSKEPWQFGTEAQGVMSASLRYRHRLIPYLYTQNVLGSRSNRPLVQPIYWEFPGKDEAYIFRNPFYFGNQLFVAPITSPRDLRTGFGSSQAWLPPTSNTGSTGRWVDIFTGTVYDGNRVCTFYRPLSGYPVLAREGSIIPLDDSSKLHNGGKNPIALELIVVSGADAKFDLIEDNDDDKTTKEEFEERITSIAWDQQKGLLTISPTETRSSSENSRSWTIKFLSSNVDPSRSSVEVSVDGTPKSEYAGFSHNVYPETPALVITIPPTSIKSQVSIQFDKPPQLEVQSVKGRLNNVLKQYQIPFKTKDLIWEVVNNDDIQSSIKASRLLELDADKLILGPILEVLLADSRA